MRLNKYIASKNIASRREADKLIEEGKVVINGSVVTNKATIVSDDDKVEFLFDVKKIRENKVVIKLNKPKGYVVSNNAKEGIPILNLVNKDFNDIYPVGRLDKDSMGLIILTNDGVLAKKIIAPMSSVEKEYYVRVDNEITDGALEKLRFGLSLDGEKLKRANVVRIDKTSFYITLTEGKNRQIRRMCTKVGLEVIVLKRIRIAKIKLDRLKEGEYLKLNESEISSLFN